MKQLLYLLLPLTLLMGCGGTDEPDLPTDTFDRQAMLRHWADNYIIPAYTAYAAATHDLAVAATSFSADANPTTLADLRDRWYDAYLIWQRISMLETGIAASLELRNNTNVYPVDTTGILTNISAGNANLELPSNLDRQGFGALDYLLYGVANTDEEVLAFYLPGGEGSADALSYLHRLALRLDALAQQVLVEWRDNGLRETFIENDGSSATASVDEFTNAFVFYYEKALRAGKVGIPGGVFSGSPLATHVEAPYYGQNRQFLLTALDACRDFFNGLSFDRSISGPSYRQYLEELQAAKDGTNIAQLVNDQFTLSRNKILNLEAELAAQVQTDNQAMLATYDELQRNVVFLKVDMLQALSIAVTYVDADGD